MCTLLGGANGRGGAGFLSVGQKKNGKDVLLPLRVDRNFQWVGRSTEWVGPGLPGLSLKPPLANGSFVIWHLSY